MRWIKKNPRGAARNHQHRDPEQLEITERNNQKLENVATQKTQHRQTQKPRTTHNNSPENTNRPTKKEKNLEHQPRKH